MPISGSPTDKYPISIVGTLSNSTLTKRIGFGNVLKAPVRSVIMKVWTVAPFRAVSVITTILFFTEFDHNTSDL